VATKVTSPKQVNGVRSQAATSVMTNTQKKIAHSIWRNQMIQKIICPECKGEGEVEYDHWSLRSFQKDVGEFVSKIEICATCEGSGQVDEIEDDGFITVYNSDWIKK
jgi:DnaJ-class molecular chaperone|tara:strand:+ start:855 stop:1175 length:321 start_codon:yes stop_codon:yes gene_type:complete